MIRIWVNQIISGIFKKRTARAFSVVYAFRATHVVSGRVRDFNPGETLLSDTRRTDWIAIVEIEQSLFEVERSIFEDSCKRKNDRAAIKLKSASGQERTLPGR